MDLFHTLGTFFIPFRPGTLRQTIAYHMVLIITNRYENLAPGMKTGHLGMKQMPRVWKVCIKVWKKTMAVLSQTSCIPYVFNYTKMVWKCCTRYEKSSFGYETNAKGMKSLHDGMKQMTNVLKQTHIWRMPTLYYQRIFSGRYLCGFVLYLSGRYLCGVGLFCTIVD